MNAAFISSAVARGESAGGCEPLIAPPAVIFTLPMPPSVNRMFKNVKRGRAKTAEYIDWQMAARSSLRQQKVEGIAGRVIVVLGFERQNEAADVDNRIKALLDILTETHGVGIIDDDKNVTAVLASWLPRANGLAHVRIMAVSPFTAAFHPGSNGAAGSWIVSAPFDEGDHDGLEPE